MAENWWEEYPTDIEADDQDENWWEKYPTEVKEAPTAPIEQPEEKPFDAGQYIKPMGYLERLGITSYDTDNEVYRSLAQEERFKNATPSDRRAMYRQAVDAYNQALYQSQVNANQGGTQQITDSEGNTRNYLIPRPETRESDRVLGETGGKIVRSAVGGLNEAVKAGLQAGEYVGDTLLNPFGISEGDYFKENYPSIPPESSADAIGQEVISTMVGGGAGFKLTEQLSKAYNITPKMADYVAKQWGKVSKKGKSPDAIRQKAKKLIDTLVLGTGANIGATVLSPDTAEPLFGDDILEAIGLEADDNPNLSIFADNVAFSGAIMSLGALGKSILGLGGSVTKGIKGLTKNSRDADVGLMVLTELDENLKNVPAEVLADRAIILGEILQRNSTFRTELLSGVDVPLSSPTALREGVKEYVDRAYSALEPLYDSPEEFTAFKEKLMGDMVSKMVDLRRTRNTSDAVRQQERTFTEGLGAALTDTADELGGEGAVQSAASTLGQPIVDELADARSVVDDAIVGLDEATSRLNVEANQNIIIDRLREVVSNNALGSDAVQRKALENLTGPELFNAWKRSRDAYKTAFENLPEVKLNNKEFLKLIQEASSALNVIDEVTIANQVQNQPFKALIDIAKGTAKGLPKVSSQADLLEALEKQGLTLTAVFKDIRPRIEQRIKSLKMKGEPFDALKKFKDGIDELVQESKNPAFKEALDLYENHMKIFAETEPLQQYSRKAKEVVPSTGKGRRDAYKAGMDALTASFGSENSNWIEPFMIAIQQADVNVQPQMAEAFVGQGMAALAATLRPGSNVTSTEIINALRPMLVKLETVSPETLQRFDGVVKSLQDAESGLVQAAEVEKLARTAMSETINAAKSKAASKLIYQISGVQPTVTANAQNAFKRIFNNPDSPNFLPELMDEAEKAGPLAVEGIQAAFLKDLFETLQITKVVGSGAADPTKNVRAMSSAKVASILNDPSSPVLKNLQTIFRDNPDRAAQVFRVLEIHDIDAGGKAMRGEVFGSTTTYDQDLKKLMDRVVTLRYGVLNTRATIVRNLGDAITKGGREKIQEAAQATLADIAAYPDEFARILELVAAGQERSATGLMRDLSLRAGYISQDDVFDPIDDQMREAMPQ